MVLKEQVFANATAVVMGVFYLACTVLSYLIPDVLFNLAKSWMHTISLESVKVSYVPSLDTLFLGFITAVGLTWITTYATIWLYNRLSR